MARQFKPGDLAVITQDTPGCEANVGRVVEILGCSDAGLYGDRSAWRISPVTDDLYVVEFAHGDETRFRFMERGETGVAHPGDWLMPASPDELDSANGNGAHESERRTNP